MLRFLLYLEMNLMPCVEILLLQMKHSNILEITRQFEMVRSILYSSIYLPSDAPSAIMKSYKSQFENCLHPGTFWKSSFL